MERTDGITKTIKGIEVYWSSHLQRWVTIPDRRPEWIRRMQEGKLPNKDYTPTRPDAS